jgi:hypothetical protein
MANVSKRCRIDAGCRFTSVESEPVLATSVTAQQPSEFGVACRIASTLAYRIVRTLSKQSSLTTEERKSGEPQISPSRRNGGFWAKIKEPTMSAYRQIADANPQ